jgi:GNAT superfamily N-acetyltransferase
MGRSIPKQNRPNEDIESQPVYALRVGMQKAGMVVLNEEQTPEYAEVDWKYFGRALVSHRLTIDPAYQRRGLATRLMDFTEEFAFTERYNCIRLDAFTRNCLRQTSGTIKFPHVQSSRLCSQAMG